MDRSVTNRNKNMKETFKVPSLEELCLRKAIDNVKNIGNIGGMPDIFLERILPHCNAEDLKNIEDRTKGRDLSHLTNYLWQNFYRKRFGQRSYDAVVENINGIKHVSFKWKDLYEAKLKDVEQAEQKSIERMRQLYQNENAEKRSRQVKPITKVPPSSHKRNCYGGWGPGSIVGSSKSSLMKKSKEDFANSEEVRNLTALRKNAVQKNDRPFCMRERGGFSSNGSASSPQGIKVSDRYKEDKSNL